MLKYSILFVGLLVSGSLAGVAPFIKPCTLTDENCIKESAIATLAHIVKGNQELGLPSLDPLSADDIVVDTGELKLKFSEIVVHGFSKCTFNSIKRDGLKSIFLDLECPIEAFGQYVIGGKLLIVDVEGEGPFEISGEKMHVTATLKLKEVTKSDKKYLKLSGFDYTYEPLSVFKIILKNLYNGDKAKAEPVEKLLSQEWKELITNDKIGKPVIKEFVTQVVGNIVAKIFSEVPMDELQIV